MLMMPFEESDRVFLIDVFLDLLSGKLKYGIMWCYKCNTVVLYCYYSTHNDYRATMGVADAIEALGGILS